MESIQYAYQGFAKQNYTMLDNLKLGYGGTAAEMARLINDSGVLGDTFEATADNVSSIPFDQLLLAIHAVQTEIGITGTTIAEASDTITGSWNTLTSSWTNVLTSLASGNEAFLSGSIDALASSTGDFANNVMGAVNNIINNVTEIFPKIFTAFAPMMPMLFDTLLPAVAEGAVTLVTGLAQSITDNLPLILSAGGEIVRTLIEGIFGESEQLNNTFNEISDAFNNVMSAIAESGLIQNVADLLSKIGEKALEITPVIAGIFGGGLGSIIQGVSDAIGFLADNFDTALTVLVPLTAAVVAYKTAIAISALIDGVVRAVKAWQLANEGLTLAQIILNTVMAANPIAIAIAVITALTASIIYLWNTNDDFRNALIAAWEAIKTAAETVFTSIVKFFTEDIPAAFDGFREFVNNFMADVKDFFVTGWNSIVQFVTETIPKMIDDIQQWFSELPYKIGYAIGSVVGTIVKWCADLVSTIKTEVPKIIDNVIIFFQELPGKIYTAIVTTIDKVIQWGSEVLATAKTQVTTIINGVITAFKELPGKIYNEIIKAKDKVIEWARNLVNTAKTEMPKFANAVLDAVKDLPGKFINIGRDIVNGLVQGIQNTIGSAKAKINSFFSGITAGVKGVFETESPSKVFRDEIGAMLPAGMAIGIEKGTPKAIESAEKMAKDTFNSAKTWIDDYRNKEDYLASEEIKMWEHLATVYTAVSKEKVEIDKNIAKLKEQVAKEDFEKSKNWIEKRKFFG